MLLLLLLLQEPLGRGLCWVLLAAAAARASRCFAALWAGGVGGTAGQRGRAGRGEQHNKGQVRTGVQISRHHVRHAALCAVGGRCGRIAGQGKEGDTAQRCGECNAQGGRHNMQISTHECVWPRPLLLRPNQGLLPQCGTAVAAGGMHAPDCIHPAADTHSHL